MSESKIGTTGIRRKDGGGIIETDDIIEAVASDECLGFCRYCGEQNSNIEPDAVGYDCQSCGRAAVDGAEELLMRLL